MEGRQCAVQQAQLELLNLLCGLSLQLLSIQKRLRDERGDAHSSSLLAAGGVGAGVAACGAVCDEFVCVCKSARKQAGWDVGAAKSQLTNR